MDELAGAEEAADEVTGAAAEEEEAAAEDEVDEGAADEDAAEDEDPLDELIPLQTWTGRTPLQGLPHLQWVSCHSPKVRMARPLDFK